MKSITASLLKPGMVFTEPVFIDSNSILVPAGIPVRQKDLDNLQAWGIESVLTDGLPSFPDAPEENRPAQSPSMFGPASPVAGRANSLFSMVEIREKRNSYREYTSLVERANMELLRIHTKESLHDNRQITELSSRLLQAVRDKGELLACFILGGEIAGFEMAKSSVNSAILSALMAHDLKLPNHKVLTIIIGALLHDVGMLRLPKDILEKRGELSDQERRVMRTHPLLTHRIVTKELNYGDELGAIVLQHHERWDGEGYPYRIAGDKIDLGARIVSIADAFEAMVSQKPYRNPITGYQAMKNLLSDNSRRFDPELLKAFILIMGMHPIGSIIRLNNGTVGRVMESRAIAPLRPKIQVLVDDYGKANKSRGGVFIDLLLEKNLYITGAMTTKELFELDV